MYNSTLLFLFLLYYFCVNTEHMRQYKYAHSITEVPNNNIVVKTKCHHIYCIFEQLSSFISNNSGNK